jgi:hypothetical protein
MLVVLKLQQKLTAPRHAGGPRPRVTTFDKNQGRQVVVSGGLPAALASFDELAHVLTASEAQPIATLDHDGSLLLSGDTARMEELLHPPGQPYSFARQGERQVLVRQLDGGIQLQGWLEANPQNPARPLAKFEVARSRPAARSNTLPANQEARRTRVHESR